MAGQVKVCGKRGLVVFCLDCCSWQPFTTTKVEWKPSDHLGAGLSGAMVEQPPRDGGWCKTCQEQLPEVEG